MHSVQTLTSRVVIGLAAALTMAACGSDSESSEQEETVVEQAESSEVLEDPRTGSDPAIETFTNSFLDTSLANKIREYEISPDSPTGDCLKQHQDQRLDAAVTFVIATCDPSLIAGEFFEEGGEPVIEGVTLEQQKCAALEMVKFLTTADIGPDAAAFVNEHWIPRSRVAELATIVEPECGVSEAQLTELNEYLNEQWYG